jgi:hypothetical protein
VKRRFAALVGHERRMDTAHDELSAKTGPAREQEQQVQAQEWSTRLRDVLEEDPPRSRACALLAELGPAPAPIIAPAFQQARADQGSQAANISGSFSGNTGKVYVGVGKVDKRRFRFVLVPIGFFGRAIRKLAGAHPVVATAAAAGVIGVSPPGSPWQSRERLRPWRACLAAGAAPTPATRA